MKRIITQNYFRSLKILEQIFLLLALTAIISLSSCSEITAPADNSAPSTPRDFTLIGGGDGQAHFRWEINSEKDFKEYRLYRSVNNTNSFNLLVSIIQTEYLDRFLEYDTTYYYYLTAVDNAGNESAPTTIIDIQPLNLSAPQPPARLNVSGYNNPQQGIQEIKLNWVPPDIGDLKSYLVYRSEDSIFTANPSSFIDSTNISFYEDKVVQPNKKYYYKIVAADKGNKLSLPSKVGVDLILSSPNLISPANNTRFSNPKIFNWDGVSGAVSYEVFVGNGPFSDVIWSSGKIAQTEASYTGTALQTSKVYYWWVAVYSKDRITFEDDSIVAAQINSYSLINSFFAD